MNQKIIFHTALWSVVVLVQVVVLIGAIVLHDSENSNSASTERFQNRFQYNSESSFTFDGAQLPPECLSPIQKLSNFDLEKSSNYSKVFFYAAQLLLFALIGQATAFVVYLRSK